MRWRGRGSFLSRGGWTLALTVVLSAVAAAAPANAPARRTRAQAPPQSQSPPLPVPKPFPQPGRAGSAPPADPATAAAAQTAEAGAAEPDLMGVPVYPGAEYLGTYNAGRGQQVYLYGTNLPYADIVAYYKGQMKNGGRELFKAPATQQWDLGKFNEDTMVFQPSVVVKDYTWNEMPGYLYVSGTATKRFKTIIQVVPK